MEFILDLPWTKESLQQEPISDKGEWIVTSKSALKPGKYTLYAEFLDDQDNVVGRTEDYKIEVLPDAVDEEAKPITSPGEGVLQISTTHPTLVGKSTAGTNVILWDGFSKKPGRILVNLWKSEGLFLTIRVTILSFSFALLLGLVFGLMRVSDQSPDLRKGLPLRLLVGLGVNAILLVLGTFPSEIWKIALIFLGVEVLLVIFPALPYTISTLYVEVIRGLPMLVIVLYMGYLLNAGSRGNGEYPQAAGRCRVPDPEVQRGGSAFGQNDYGEQTASVFDLGGLRPFGLK